MRRHLILLLIIFVLVMAIVIAAIWTQIEPKYQATAEVRIRDTIPYLVFQTEDNGRVPSYNSFVNTQVSIMRSLTVLQRVLDQKEVQETQWYKNVKRPVKDWLLGKPPVPPIERLWNCLTIRPRHQTEIIDVSLIGTSASDAKIIVNAVLDQYIRYVNEVSYVTKDDLYNKLVEQYNKFEREIQGREQICAELRKLLGMGIPQELISSKRMRLDETKARHSELKQDIIMLEWKMEKLQNLMEQEIVSEQNDVSVHSNVKIERRPKYHEDAEWRALDRNVRTIQHGISMSEREPNNPEIIRVTKELKFAKELLRLREEQLDEQWRDKQKNTDMQVTIASASGPGYEEKLKILELQLAQAKYEEQLLLETIRKEEAEFEELFINAQLLEKEEKALAHKHELFRAVRQRIDAKNMERNIPGRIEVLMRAFVPSMPYKDHRILYTAITLVISGLGLGITVWILDRHMII